MGHNNDSSHRSLIVITGWQLVTLEAYLLLFLQGLPYSYWFRLCKLCFVFVAMAPLVPDLR
jgi:hypothetical protein